MRITFMFIAIFISATTVFAQQTKVETYTNSKYGFTFTYPSTWIKDNHEVEAVNRSGTVISVELNFTDTASQSSLLMAYHLAPQGAELYKYQLSEYNSSQGWYKKGRKQLVIAGNKAIEAFAVISKDGKGKKLNTSIRFINVHLLDKNKTGEVEFQFKTPMPCEKVEVAKFKQILSAFKFIN